MNSKAGVVIGLIIGLVVLTVPFWYALGQLATGQSDPPPSLALPTNAERCVEANMRAVHMQVIDEWRDAVVRDGVTDKYESTDFPGELYERSLTKTCLMQCHATAKVDTNLVADGQAMSVQQRFCNECHQYANVRPNCWDCHLEGSPK
jgi:hypothetical protein